MRKPRKKGDWLVVVLAILAAALVLTPLGLYVGCYFGMSDTQYGSVDGKRMCWHIYDAHWKVDLFSPAAKVESLLTGQEVSNHHDFGYRDHVQP